MPSPIAERLARECLAVRLRTLSRAVTRIYDDALRPLGLTVGQLNLLGAIDHLGEEATAERLARGLEIESSTLSRNLGLLARRGWVEAHPRSEGRGQVWRLTRQGAERLRHAEAPWLRAQRRARRVLSEWGDRCSAPPGARSGAIP